MSLHLERLGPKLLALHGPSISLFSTPRLFFATLVALALASLQCFLLILTLPRIVR